MCNSISVALRNSLCSVYLIFEWFRAVLKHWYMHMYVSMMCSPCCRSKHASSVLISLVRILLNNMLKSEYMHTHIIIYLYIKSEYIYIYIHIWKLACFVFMYASNAVSISLLHGCYLMVVAATTMAIIMVVTNCGESSKYYSLVTESDLSYSHMISPANWVLISWFCCICVKNSIDFTCVCVCMYLWVLTALHVWIFCCTYSEILILCCCQVVYVWQYLIERKDDWETILCFSS